MQIGDRIATRLANSEGSRKKGNFELRIKNYGTEGTVKTWVTNELRTWVTENDAGRRSTFPNIPGTSLSKKGGADIPVCRLPGGQTGMSAPPFKKSPTGDICRIFAQCAYWAGRYRPIMPTGRYSTVSGT